jgi:hypothetical protein
MSGGCNIARRHFNEVDKLRHYDDDDDELQFIACIRQPYLHAISRAKW